MNFFVNVERWREDDQFLARVFAAPDQLRIAIGVATLDGNTER